MAGRNAKVTSIDSIPAFKLALQEFTEDVYNSLVQLEIESRRAVEWIEGDRSRYWPRMLQDASNARDEARTALEQCELTIDGSENRSCYDQRKAYEKAKARFRLCEAKIQAVRKWKVLLHKEVEGFRVELAKLKQYLDNDVVKSFAVLDRLIAALERYAQTTGLGKAGEPTTAGASSATDSSSSTTASMATPLPPTGETP